VCSPDHQHAQQSIDCLRAGLHVLAEKPMATSTTDALRMIQAAHVAGRKLMVHHQMRHVPSFRAAKGIVDKGALGLIFGIEADYYHDMRKRAVAFDDWRTHPDTCQNIIFGGACHPLDLMQWVIGDKIQEVFAYANHEAFKAYPDVDTVMAVLKFSRGCIGRMTMTIGCNRPQENSLVVLGDGGTLVNGLLLRSEPDTWLGRSPFLNIPLVQRVLQRMNRTLKLRSEYATSMIHFPSENLNLIQRLLGSLCLRVGNVIHYPYNSFEHGVACKSLINDFLRSIAMDTPPPIDPQDSLDAIRVCEAVIKSYKTGQPVKVVRDTD
jgi:predicted dehydrogenase